jgi:predicted transcriptional regulator of viral defense system
VVKPQDRLSGFVDRLQAGGEYVFSKAEAARTLDRKPEALQKALERMQRKNRVARLRRGFFVIVPLEYIRRGAPPAEWYIDALMRRENKPYYVGLLSAARYHGAAHQQPQELQVVVGKQVRPLRVRNSRIRFIQKSRFSSEMDIVPIKTETGFMRISSPELTALDMIRFSASVGGLSTVVTVLAELSEKVAARGLLLTAKREKELAPIRRLGAILDRLGFSDRTAASAEWLKSHPGRAVRLDPSAPARGFPLDPKWNVIINGDIHPEA